jgi:2EXR family
MELTSIVPASGDTMKNFTRFPKLPIELRLKIWRSTKEPRIIEVRFHFDCRKKKHSFFAPQPVVLQVCHESRHEGLKSYKKAFTNKWAYNDVYFDFTTDILFINYSLSQSQMNFFLERQKTEDLTKVQRLAIPCKDFFIEEGFMSKLQGLKELIAMSIWGFTCHTRMASCPWYGIGFHDLEELGTTEEDPAADYFHRCLANAPVLYDMFKKEMQEKFPEAVVPIHKVICDKDTSSRYLSR